MPVAVTPPDWIHPDHVAQHITNPDNQWRTRAACTGMDPNLFHPRRAPAESPAAPHARAICHTCPVTHQCLAEALTTTPTNDTGIWGATGPRQRATLRRNPTIRRALTRQRRGGDG